MISCVSLSLQYMIVSIVIYIYINMYIEVQYIKNPWKPQCPRPAKTPNPGALTHTGRRVQPVEDAKSDAPHHGRVCIWDLATNGSLPKYTLRRTPHVSWTCKGRSSSVQGPCHPM